MQPCDDSQDCILRRGIDEAVKLILSENNTLFQSITAKLINYPELRASLRSILMEGTKLTYNPDQEDISKIEMYGLIRNDHNTVRVKPHFETRLYNLFLSDEELKNNVFPGKESLGRTISSGMGKLICAYPEHFIITYTQVCGPLKDRFKERRQGTVPAEFKAHYQRKRQLLF